MLSIFFFMAKGQKDKWFYIAVYFIGTSFSGQIKWPPVFYRWPKSLNVKAQSWKLFVLFQIYIILLEHV